MGVCLVPDPASRFTELYELYHQRVLGYALRRAEPEVAHEVATETFIVAWRRLDSVPERPLPWLLVTARNILSDQARRGRRQDALVAEIARCTEQDDHVGAEALVLERITVLSALAALGEREREALMLTVWDGLPHREAARIADCSMAAFAVRLHRARRRLAAEMDRLDRGEPAALRNARSSFGTAQPAATVEET